jgi:hypothetical protein
MAAFSRKSPDYQCDPPVGAIAIDYSSTDQDIQVPARGVYISTTGALKVDMADGTTVTFSSLAAGIQHAMYITKIYKTGSTAAGLVLY